MQATVQQVLNYAKRSLEKITGAEITSIRFRATYKPENIERLKIAVCKAYGIPIDKLAKRCRKQELVRPRQMFYYIALTKFSMKVTEAGKVFRQDHTTAIHSKTTVENLLSIMDEDTHEKLELINEYLKL